jgi:hypothetical protein
MGEIVHELFGMAFSDRQSKFPYSTNREFSEFLFMFHVEQLRESDNEVKTFRNGQIKTLRLLA